MSSIQPVNVRFPALLEQPPVDRVRKVRRAQLAPLRYVTDAYRWKKIPSSEGWFIQSWRSPKAVAIGCTRLTSSGAVEGCQLLPQGQIPGKRCLGEEAFISQRYCDPFMTPRPSLSSPPNLPHPTSPLSNLFVFLG
jgi:hypothetical protein